MFSRRFLLGAGAAAPWLATGPAFASPTAVAPPTVDDLLKPALLRDAALSPDGEQIAALWEQHDGDTRTAYVRLAKAGAPEQEPSTVVVGDCDVEQVAWANNERLLIWLSLTRSTDNAPTGLFFDGEFYPIPVRRIISIDLQGKNQVLLFGAQNAFLRRDFNLGSVVDFLVDDPQHVLMKIFDYSHQVFALHLVDVYTGQATLLERGGADTESWVIQNGVPLLRCDVNRRGTVVSLYGRPQGEKSWKLIRKIRRDEARKLANFNVVGSAPEADVILVSSRMDGQDKAVIRKFDLKTLTFGEVLCRHDDCEMDDVFQDRRRNLIAGSYTDDRRNYVFADPGLAAHFRSLNRHFGDECNLDLYEIDDAHNRFVLKIAGPRTAGEFHLYDQKTQRLTLIGEQRPWLTKDRLAKVLPLRIKARDGVALSAYLTMPVGADETPRPLVVLPHGGPELRDALGFDPFAQALAARGWMVLQPNFRGSGQLGKAFADAGRHRWGDLMQQDVDDTVAALVRTGRVDTRRIAICGASYGGYAALMGAICNPERYCAVVAIAGPSDLIEFLSYWRNEDGSDSDSYAYWRTTIGDPKTDADSLRAASPATRAAEIRPPVLLIHGSEDNIVPPDQSKIMQKALKKAGKAAELVVLKGFGHRDWDDATWKTVLTRSCDHIAAAFAT